MFYALQPPRPICNSRHFFVAKYKAAGEAESWISDFPFCYLFEQCLDASCSIPKIGLLPKKSFCEGSNTLFEGLIGKMTPTALPL